MSICCYILPKTGNEICFIELTNEYNNTKYFNRIYCIRVHIDDNYIYIIILNISYLLYLNNKNEKI